jgi:uncharacterized DUF497 family protein
MDAYERLAACTGFDWDEGNLLKNWEKHRVSAAECEEVFFNRPLVAAPDPGHASAEPRFFVLGQSDAGRKLFLVFTTRENLIRVISARDMTKRERARYQRHG